MNVLKGRRDEVIGLLGGESGFTIAELAIVVLILGFLIFVASLELRSTNNVTTANSAVVQVGRVLKEAYSIAQQEKVQATVNFYSSANSDNDKKNSYEVLRGTASMRPPIGVKYKKVNVGGSDHYYCKLLEGGSEPYFPADVTIYLKPVGAVTMCVDSVGAPATGTVNITCTGVGTKTITVNEQGEVSP